MVRHCSPQSARDRQDKFFGLEGDFLVVFAPIPIIMGLVTAELTPLTRAGAVKRMAYCVCRPFGWTPEGQGPFDAAPLDPARDRQDKAGWTPHSYCDTAYLFEHLVELLFGHALSFSVIWRFRGSNP